VLSTDNLSRPREELVPLLGVLGELFERLPNRARQLDCSVRVIGDLDRLPAKLAAQATAAVASAGRGTWQVTVALAYGGRQEIVDACRALVEELVERGVPAAELAGAIDDPGLATHLYQPDMPDPDIIIRTSGETRISGFLLW